MSAARLDPIFPVPGAAAGGENAVPVFEGFRHGSPGMRSVRLREGDNPQ
ncbi:MAG TPA: hypothetical protein VEP68_03355 [Anaeromyxobacteraceae bacterium]|nr:hypothetical protein [Anaeromyxobacteraceae bacterium]